MFNKIRQWIALHRHARWLNQALFYALADPFNSLEFALTVFCRANRLENGDQTFQAIKKYQCCHLTPCSKCRRPIWEWEGKSGSLPQAHHSCPEEFYQNRFNRVRPMTHFVMVEHNIKGEGD